MKNHKNKQPQLLQRGVKEKESKIYLKNAYILIGNDLKNYLITHRPGSFGLRYSKCESLKILLSLLKDANKYFL